MIIGNCREKFTRDAFPLGTRFRKKEDIPEKEINPYWQGRLGKKNWNYINGYDEAVSAVEYYFDMVGEDEELARFIGRDELNRIGTFLSRTNAEDEHLTHKKAFHRLSPIGQLLVALRSKLLESLERNRNERITEILENENYVENIQRESFVQEEKKAESLNDNNLRI